ncbi:MAG TPA: 2-oxoacid:acceptor oxidoreductase subunit alpha [Candidatus Fermentibacter daniensis]|nr:MAG: 2-oxoglutarate oxidoreductase subunit KorA [candidate division Hyd24-12 bacterium ADurb.Bin004]HOD19725.1 2-oxoacid:acceptor oxidoreductase subunit alpha [Candidatus Fermentibacter daniensis]HQM41231.1 2-oxoacid:acceptor oxidoreductase subunit alpha [Candidatus Fermentibacter daniensis]
MIPWGETRLVQGNEAIALGALASGVRFFGGYPITPSTEVAEILARKLPEVDGVFIQMEDEIASISSVMGASLAGARAMTATSGPGFSLMQEGLGYGCMAEIPFVVVDVMRAGPSTGLPTQVSQGDVMQARWGTHGDHPVIALCPSSVRECFDMTVRAFNLAEEFRTPVLLLSDEVIGHMRERVTFPRREDVKILERPVPETPKEWYEHYHPTPSNVSPMASYGSGYRFHVTGLTHDRQGFPTRRVDEVDEKMARLKNKIVRRLDELVEVKTHDVEQSRVVVFAYGSVYRSALAAQVMLEKKHKKIGVFRPVTLWPFPDREVKELLDEKDVIIVPELNQGQLIHEVERLTSDCVRIVPVQRVDGYEITPEEIVHAAMEVM